MDAYAARREGNALTHRQTLLLVFGMLLPTFMGSLDQTILATALPTIGRDFDDIHSLPWLITAYLLASTAIIPLYGTPSAPIVDGERSAPSVRDATGIRRIVFGGGFRWVRRLEEATGLATNLRVLARPI